MMTRLNESFLGKTLSPKEQEIQEENKIESDSSKKTYYKYDRKWIATKTEKE